MQSYKLKQIQTCKVEHWSHWLYLAGYVLDDFPTLSEATLTAKDQLELIKNWKLRPDFIINLKVW